MRKRIVATEGRTFLGLVAILTLCLGSGFVQTSDDVEREQEPTREIAIRAEQFSFTPNEIEVIEGETIQLILEAIDVPHGIAVVDLGLKIVAYPGREPVVVEFRAETPGRFRFTCAVFCGNGHDAMTGVLTVVPASARTNSDTADHVDVAEPDFNLITLPTTLRLPHHSFAFRLTHRFSRPLDGGPGYGNFAEDFFGFDSAAFIGLELRYGFAPGMQVGIYRNNNRNIQVFGKYNLLWRGHEQGIGLDAYVSIEGTNNLRDDHSPALGVVLSKQLGDRVSVYIEPVWVGNTNKSLLHPEPGFISTDDHSLLTGLATRIRARETVYLVAEYVPRVSGFASGDDHISFGLEKHMGGHLFQINVSNGLGNTPAQLAGGAQRNAWFIGFNITRKFY